LVLPALAILLLCRRLRPWQLSTAVPAHVLVFIPAISLMEFAK
jgi:hypothetical protein